ncbi:ead/Ea22-like family protein [Klebsiella pneumoniae]|uniref:ead/Ea22-like family protein n=1 Tax=Klebsiella pneumoniae TaxID=573 RepID=UPI0021AD4C07|nr:ead/Ea22-like family protein [Klebsiella pneumoniae]UVF98904.1 ead/Ea22-like family protein [Klebsiella pneumoniae]UVG04390.1 ead/Ea22-like family protein [Klebsiella pneumoniae]
MTDITELAQSLKAAAEKATQGNWRAFKYHDGRCGIGGGHHDEIMVCEHISKRRPHDAEFIALANPANILALVEALEKAQGMEAYWKTQCRGITDHCEELQARIAELESRTVTAAAAAVLAERKRQVAAEGWTPGHDDEYEHGELADAAGCYALSSELFDCAGEPPRPWPWPDEWWKPTNRRRDLVKAGALILAEIERLDRAAGIKWEAE